MGRIWRGFPLIDVALCCLLMASCDEGNLDEGNPVVHLETTNATLEGTVTYHDRPVPYALVIASAPGGERAVTAYADAQGRYRLTSVPLDEVQIGVDTKAGRGQMMGRMMAASRGAGGEMPTFVDVPEKYFHPRTSGVTTTISDGPNTFDIELD